MGPDYYFDIFEVSTNAVLSFGPNELATLSRLLGESIEPIITFPDGSKAHIDQIMVRYRINTCHIIVKITWTVYNAAGRQQGII